MTTNQDALKDLIEYFKSQSARLNDTAISESIFDNSNDRGEIKECILQGFLENHLPKRCEIIRGGFIFNTFGKKSRQIDLIVTSEFTLQFRQSFGKHDTKSFNCAEGTIAAISVKSELNKAELCDAIDNLASIPTGRFYLTDPHDELAKELLSLTPYKVIFAYRGINPKALIKDLENHLKINKIPKEKAPDLIIVNNCYYFSKRQHGHLGRMQGDNSTYGSYIVRSNSKRIGALGLVALVSAIQQVSNLGSLVMLNFYKYENAMLLDFNDSELKFHFIDSKKIFGE